MRKGTWFESRQAYSHKYATYRQNVEERRRPRLASGPLLYYQYTYADLVG
jgi:hypothetical protein